VLADSNLIKQCLANRVRVFVRCESRPFDEDVEALSISVFCKITLRMAGNVVQRDFLGLRVSGTWTSTSFCRFSKVAEK